jgi:hypothetical protein
LTFRTGSIVVTAGNAVEVGDGLYKYTLASGSVTVEGEYTAVFKTGDATVDQQWVPSLWIVGRDGDEHLTADIPASAPAMITPQQVRDAMKLAPTATADAAGSVDKHLDDIQAFGAPPTPPTAAAIEAEILDALTSDHTLPGTVGKAIGDVNARGDPWVAPSRTLTQTGAQAAAAMTGSDLLIRRDVTYTATLTGINFPALWTRCYLTVKVGSSDEDAHSIIRLAVSKPAAPLLDGLLCLEQTPYATLAHGSLVANEGASTLAIVLADDATALLLSREGLVYGVKFILSDGSSQEPYVGFCDIGLAVTRALA